MQESQPQQPLGNLLDGKSTAQAIKNEIATEVARMKSQGLRAPHLVAILVGNNGASETYVAGKVKSCAEIGFQSTLLRFESTISEAELLDAVQQVNDDEGVDGLIVQLPLPAHISVEKVTEKILPYKDVDGFHPINMGRMAMGLPAFVAATPYGIIQLLERYNIPTVGKHCVIVGRSHIVGLPMSLLMARNTYPGNCTVTLCHSRTANIAEQTRQADILVAALGKPGFITADMVKEGAVVIDVGLTRVEDASKKSGFALKGDVRFEEVAPKSSYITPVPGGVGLMTNAALMQNTLLSAQKKIYQW